MNENNLNTFLDICREVSDSSIEIERGKKYGRIVVGAGPYRSAFGFINLENGDILKAASWKTPHPTPRGNISDEDNGRKAVTRYGIVYLR